ncbi:MAG: bifunctional glutamate N-acetyltransferase/amino-acid acetyltransferase ArgJ [Limnochordia bacterium]|nr:bifunctional glutamate N-acetyltransferase/amino-acid acetyltransferase ArgJ [Limnochordia bacterium]
MKLIEGGITAATGYVAAGVYSGIKKKRTDLALVFTKHPAVAAAMFTKNLVAAAPVQVCKEQLAKGPHIQAIVVNSGNANACTGPDGLAKAWQMIKKTAQVLGLSEDQVLVASTGVIGQSLPIEKIESGIEEAAARLSENGGCDAASAIMTTDTFAKEIAVEYVHQGHTIRVGGMAKGSGMIHPNMATMLAFVTTDVDIAPELLDRALKMCVDRTFHMITVDGDTSTNDSVMLLANGAAGNPRITCEDDSFAAFCKALAQVTEKLAKDIVKDGEGATKMIEIKVQNAPTEKQARQIAKSIAGSNLVKTAIFGEDANWGRILCAAGYAGVDFDPWKTDVFIGDLQVAQQGGGLEFDEELAKEILSQKTIVITVDLKQGPAEATAWTCDLTYDYVKINAHYRT